MPARDAPSGSQTPSSVTGVPGEFHASQHPHHNKRWTILVFVLIAQVVILLDATVVNVALPSAQKDLGFSDANRQWVITAYVLAFGSLLPVGGRLSDLIGQKAMFLTGLVGFALSSALGGAAPDIGALVASRALQGAFAAVLAPAALSLIATSFSDRREASKAFGLLGAVAGSAAVIGLILGGVLTQYLDWRWCMYVNIVFAILGLFGGARYLTNIRDERRPKISVSSALIGSLGVFGVVYGVSRAQIDAWSATATLVPLLVGAASIAAFVPLQRYSSYPLMPLRIFTDRNRGAAYLTLFLGNVAQFAIFLFLTYYFQGVLHYSPVKTGFAFVPLAAASATSATFAQAKLIDKFSVRTIVSTGLIISAAGCALLTRAGVGTDYAVVLPGLILVGAGVGSALVVSTANGLHGVAHEDAGAAGAINNVSQQLGSAFGVAFLSTVAGTANSDYLADHFGTPDAVVNATLHGFKVGYTWAVVILTAAAVFCGLLIHPKTYVHGKKQRPKMLQD
ncbi:MFS transporter [Streptomyces sp. NPDC056663]|uniref:MFS transporter n=1 Tax=Streptomyces sp. NPDC056663 TaxID=3345899 RepID=UPI0036B43332